MRIAYTFYELCAWTMKLALKDANAKLTKISIV
jgi:hypothetical protein